MVASGNNDPSKKAFAQFMMNRRRMLALGGMTAGAGALAACGGNTGREEGGDGISLSQWYHEYGEAGTQQAAQGYAEAYPDANVSIEWIPGDYDSALSSGLLTDDGPDVFESHLNRGMVEAGQLEPLDDIVADVLDDIPENDIARNTIDGTIYGIRMIDDPQYIVYRPSMFEAAGISAPPTTFDELVEVAIELTNGDVKGIDFTDDGGTSRLGQHMIKGLGLSFIGDDMQAGFDDPRILEGAESVKRLQDSDALLLGAPTSWWDPSSMIQGLTAMSWTGLWTMPALLENLGDDVGVFPCPAFAGGSPTVYNGGWSTFVNANGPNVEAAKAFTKWLWVDNEEYILDWCLSYGFHIPSRKSLRAKADQLTSGPAADAVAISEEYGWADDPNWTPAMNTAVNDMMSNIVVEGNDPESELTKAIETVNSELDGIFG
ncbi:extracellular solute-binding protein [Glycomyces sp. L485]|uniref:ABC transporter substrate-binding protein n=1 Tax=Glycomyces sp. L485 TaxID=2909235 RepID=UPI001F4A4401|nr:extracellular solute-binding protein [Glycomyces sp. L485]MCH7230379.1 extracellular solute-binding protein [Glycomyces sp. L485]